MFDGSNKYSYFHCILLSEVSQIGCASQFVAERRHLLPSPAPLARGASHLSEQEVSFCGGDFRNFEPVKRLNYRIIDKIVRDLRRIYKENPAWFEVPTFAQKVY